MIKPQVIISALTSFIISFIEVLLGLRIFLKFFAASTNAPFVSWIYENTNPLLTPFLNAFPSPKASGFVLEFSSIFALMVYGLIGYLLSQLIDAINHFSIKLDKPDKSDKSDKKKD